VNRRGRAPSKVCPDATGQKEETMREIKARHKREILRLTEVERNAALGAIVTLLDGQEWSADTCDTIAAVLRELGIHVDDSE